MCWRLARGAHPQLQSSLPRQTRELWRRAAWFKDSNPFIKHEGQPRGSPGKHPGIDYAEPLLFRAQQLQQRGSELHWVEAQHRRGRRIFSAGTVLRPDSKYAFQDFGLLRGVCRAISV